MARRKPISSSIQRNVGREDESRMKPPPSLSRCGLIEISHADESNARTIADVSIRHATAGDADAIGRIQVETWRAAYTGLMPDEAIASFDVESRQQLWREWLGRESVPGVATFDAERDGDVIGFAGVGSCRDEAGSASSTRSTCSRIAGAAGPAER